MRYILFAVLIASFLMVGTADAARGAWINLGDATWSAAGSGDDKWMTFVHVMNPTASTVTATITFFANVNGGAGTTATLASTTRVLAPNALWEFSSMDTSLSTLAAAAYPAVTKGGVLIEPSSVVGTTSMFYNTTASGFNFSW